MATPLKLTVARLPLKSLQTALVALALYCHTPPSLPRIRFPVASRAMACASLCGPLLAVSIEMGFQVAPPSGVV